MIKKAIRCVVLFGLVALGHTPVLAQTTAPVTFIDGSTTLGSVGVNATTHQATLVVSTLGAGTHNVVANFVGGLNSAPSSSAAVDQKVNPE